MITLTKVCKSCGKDFDISADDQKDIYCPNCQAASKENYIQKHLNLQQRFKDIYGGIML